VTEARLVSQGRRAAGAEGPSEAGAGRAGPGDEAAGPAGPARRPGRGPAARAALLNAGLLVATTVAVAAFEPKFPKLVGD
jgi:hypothetical protein